MKTIALASRLMRDLKEKALADLTADARLEMVDAINSSLQKMDALAAPHSKQRPAAFSAAAPTTISIGVTAGSTEITGYTFTTTYCTIRIDGDEIDNQIVGATTLRHPYAGETGTVSAVIYGDALLVPSTIAEIATDFFILETRSRVSQDFSRTIGTLDAGHHQNTQKRTGRPDRWWMEANAANQGADVPSVIRFNTLPDRAYRMQADVVMAPLRVTFADLMDSDAALAMRPEHVESFLLPICRGALAASSMWANPDEKASAKSESEDALQRYSILAPKTLSTPANRVGTPKGF